MNNLCLCINPKRKTGPRYHRGTTLIGVLACLLVGMLLTCLSVQSALRGRREARLERQRIQTEWLVEGGIVRAVQALRASPTYTGETWQPELGVEPLCKAVVEIKVDRKNADNAADAQTNSDGASASTTWMVEVVARLDSTTDNDGPMQRSQSITIKQLPETKQTSETNSSSEKTE